MPNKTYTGTCHCGNVRFEVQGDFQQAGACNCSICSRVGWLMNSVPLAQFKLLAGEDAQTDYQFGAKTMHHLFCKTCGIHAFGRYAAEGQEKIVINLRCLPDLEVDRLELKHYDGKSY